MSDNLPDETQSTNLTEPHVTYVPQRLMLMLRTILTLNFVAFLGLSVAAQTVSIEGSDTLGDKMVPALIKAFKATGGEGEFVVKAEGSDLAFTGLASGSAQVGISSRPIKDAEKASLAAAGKEVTEHLAGVDMIAVIVNEQNAADNLPLEGIEAIFTGAVKTWKTLPGEPVIAPFTRDETSGTYKVFQELAMSKKEYGPSCVKLDGNATIAAKVGQTPGGVGYCGLSTLGAKGTKAVMINGVLPEPANASTYPLSRNLFYYTVQGQTSETAMKFLQWAMTAPEAAKIIGEVGFIAP